MNNKYITKDDAQIIVAKTVREVTNTSEFNLLAPKLPSEGV